MGQKSSKHEKTKKSKIINSNHINNNKNNKISKEKTKNLNNPDNNKDNNTNKPVNVSLSSTKCKYCNKNYIPNKVLRSHLFYCVDCYLKKKNFKYQADLEYHTELEFQEIIPEKLYLGGKKFRNFKK